MKSNKTTVTKRKLKQTAPAKMKSAITNLNKLFPATAHTESGASNGESSRKKRSVKAIPPETQQVRRPVTTVAAKVDIGFGNILFIRGEGPGLSWNKGIPLQCRDNSTWLWSPNNGNEEIEFKLLLNDQVWAEGDNLRVAPGEQIEVVPRF